MIVTFGEIMMRLAPPGYQRFCQAKSFDIIYGGGEANVAASLANFEKKARFVTKLPDNDIGKACKAELMSFGIDTDYIAMGGERLGLYFCEKGASQRPSKVVYDRAHSAISECDTDDFDWEKIFNGAEWFHFTGITPAISDNAAAATLAACKAAKAAGVKISCDLNYRKKLWSKEKANKVMGELMQYVDVLIANEEDASDVFGISAASTDITKGKISLAGYQSVAAQLIDRFGFEKVAITLRESISASHNNWSALLYDGKTYYSSKKYSIQIVDRVGGGDSFGAGLIYGLISGFDPQKALEFAVAASCLKHTIEGDVNMVTVPEVLALADGDGSGRVQR